MLSCAALSAGRIAVLAQRLVQIITQEVVHEVAQVLAQVLTQVVAQRRADLQFVGCRLLFAA